MCKSISKIVSKVVLGGTIALLCYACSTQATISGYEDSTVVLTNSYSQVRYDGCFWVDRLWEGDWNEKKSRRNTLKLVRVRIKPWQSLAAVAFWGGGCLCISNGNLMEIESETQKHCHLL